MLLLEDELNGVVDFQRAEFGPGIDVTGIKCRRHDGRITVDAVGKIGAYITRDAACPRGQTDSTPRGASSAAARATFLYSLLYLALLFAAMGADRAIAAI